MPSSDDPTAGDAVDALRFEGVYREHEPAVRRYAARRVPADRVDDVVHEAFLAAWRRLDDLPAQPLPWLLGVARNCVLHDRRSRARQGKLDERLSAQPRELAAPAAGDPELAAALRALPARDRELLSLLAWDGLAVADAARVWHQRRRGARPPPPRPPPPGRPAAGRAQRAARGGHTVPRGDPMSTDALDRLRAADPLAGRALPERDVDAGVRAITSTPRPVPARRRRLAVRVLVPAAALLVLAIGAGTAAGVRLDDLLPGGYATHPHSEGSPIAVDADGARAEAARVRAEIPDPPGFTTRVARFDEPNVVYSTGAGASTQLYLKMCSWQRALLAAHEAGDTTAEAAARRMLGRDLWYVYFVPDSAAFVKRANTDPAHLAELRQSIVANC